MSLLHINQYPFRKGFKGNLHNLLGQYNEGDLELETWNFETWNFENFGTLHTIVFKDLLYIYAGWKIMYNLDSC